MAAGKPLSRKHARVYLWKNEKKVQPPCGEFCVLNHENICLGCFRSLAEIAGWQELDDKMRLAVLWRAGRRRKAHRV